MLLMLPAAATSGFGRVGVAYTFWAHFCALIPGILGDYLRSAYYALTLEACSVDTQIGFGSYFSQRNARVARGVGIGAYCVIGRANLGEGSLIGSNVHILSGQHQHVRDAQGQLQAGELTKVDIGPNCWVGSGAMIMADIGAGATISAGAVVGTAVPAGATVAGNPARVVRTAAAATKSMV